MKKAWILPACFLLVASIVNFVARAIGDAAVAAMVKPALLPLLALTTLAAAGGSLENKTLRLLITAQLLGCAGDIFLIADGLVAFGCGLGSFLVGHIFYMNVFGARSWKGIKPTAWIGIIAVMVVLVAALILGIGVKGAMMAPIAVYGMVLMFLIFSGLAGVVRKMGYKTTWVIILVGAVLFAFSDSLIAVQMFGEKSVFLEFMVMFTYVIAQCLLAWGGVRIYEAEKGQS